MTQCEISKIIAKMQTTSCKLDATPTDLLKPPACLRIITAIVAIVNESLNNNNNLASSLIGPNSSTYFEVELGGPMLDEALNWGPHLIGPNSSAYFPN